MILERTIKPHEDLARRFRLRQDLDINAGVIKCQVPVNGGNGFRPTKYKYRLWQGYPQPSPAALLRDFFPWLLPSSSLGDLGIRAPDGTFHAAAPSIWLTSRF